jgi:hypothetical protein
VTADATSNAVPDAWLIAELRAAADRLIAGAPLRSTGKLTIRDLAAEAGIKRWILTHKHPRLMRSYQAEFSHLGKVSEPVRAARDEAGRLQGDLVKVRTDNKRLRLLVDTYAALIRELTDELIEAQAERDRALEELGRFRDSGETVHPGPPHPPAHRNLHLLAGAPDHGAATGRAATT